MITYTDKAAVQNYLKRNIDPAFDVQLSLYIHESRLRNIKDDVGGIM